MNRGAIYWINLEDATPPEFGKTRPAVIVSNTDQNEILKTVVVIPFSSQSPEIWPLRIPFTLNKLKKSYAVIPGIRQVAKERLYQFIDVLDGKKLDILDEALQLYLSD